MTGAVQVAIGLIRNRASTRNRRRAGGRVPPGVMLRETESLDELSAALAELRDAGVTLVAIDGGDGTVREVLTRLPALWGPEPPRLAILAHGNTNLVARKAGAVRGDGGLAELVGAARMDRLAERRLPVLAIERPGMATLRGFIAGWGAYATGSRIASEEIAARGGGQVALAVASTLRRALAGREAAAIRCGIALSAVADGRPWPEGPRLIGLATTLPGPLVMGINPFWGGGDGECGGTIRWLDIAAPGRRLALAVPFVLAGRPWRGMERDGYRSGRAEAIELRLAEPFVMDGERFAVGEGGRIRLSSDGEAVFVRPR